jgi:hypothetical protein
MEINGKVRVFASPMIRYLLGGSLFGRPPLVLMLLQAENERRTLQAMTASHSLWRCVRPEIRWWFFVVF